MSKLLFYIFVVLLVPIAFAGAIAGIFLTTFFTGAYLGIRFILDLSEEVLRDQTRP